MARSVTTYSAAATSVVYAGHIVEGFDEGDDAIEVSRAKDSIQATIGIKGDAVISQSTDKSGTITLRLLAGAVSNDFLSSKSNASDAGSLFAGDITIMEVGTKAGVIAEKCIIQKSPDFTRGAKAAGLEWVIFSPNIKIAHAAGTEI